MGGEKHGFCIIVNMEKPYNYAKKKKKTEETLKSLLAAN